MIKLNTEINTRLQQSGSVLGSDHWQKLPRSRWSQFNSENALDENISSTACLYFFSLNSKVSCIFYRVYSLQNTVILYLLTVTHHSKMFLKITLWIYEFCIVKCTKTLKQNCDRHKTGFKKINLKLNKFVSNLIIKTSNLIKSVNHKIYLKL